jgi:hypothetical protein
LHFSGVNVKRESDVVDACITLKDLAASLMAYCAWIAGDRVLLTSPVRLKEVSGSKSRGAAGNQSLAKKIWLGGA